MSRRSYEDLRPRRSGRSEKKKDEQEQADSSYSYDQSAEQERPEKQSLRDRWESFKVGVKNQAEKAAQDPYAGYATDPVSAVNMGYERPAAKVSKPGQKQGQQQKQEADGGEGGTLGALWSTLGIGNKPEDKTKENNAWESFADDEEADEGVEFPDEEPANGPTTDDFFPSSDEPLPSESMSDRVKTQEDLVAERNALQKQYSELYTLIYGTGVEGHDFDASAYDRLDGLGQQIKALNDQIEGRAGNILTGSLGRYFSGMTDMERTLYEAGQGARDTMNAEYLADAKHALERAEADYVAAKEMHAAGEISEEELASWKRQRDEAQQRVDAFSGAGEAQRGATAATAELADQMLASAQEDLETAKAGLSGLGKAGVDIATNVLQMGMDAGTGNLTGAGALFSMYLRTFGSSAQEARQSGADIWDQVSYGTVKAGIEVASEKMFDGVAGIYGKGSFDDFAEGLIRHLADSDTGRTILRVIEKGLEEGTEELVSDLFGPIAETIINDETLRSLFFDENGNFLRGSYSLNGQEVLYDFLIGAAIGSLGGTVEIITGQNAQANKELREADAVAALAASANQNQSAIKQAPGMEIGQETDGGDGRPQSAADVVMDALARPTANERLARREAESMANTEQAVADSVRRAADKIGTWLPESDVWKAVDWLLGRATEIDNAKTAEVVDAVREAAGEAQGPEGISTTPTSAEASTAPTDALNSYLADRAAKGWRILPERTESTQQTSDNIDYSAAAGEAYNAAAAQQKRIDDIAGEIARALGVPYQPDQQKSVKSIISRMQRNKARGRGADWHSLKDLARTHIEMNSWDDIPKVLSMLDEMKIPYTADAKQTAQGYRGLHIVWYENGIGHELQLSTPEAWAVKQKTEEIYAKWRDAETDPSFVQTEEYVRDIVEAKGMWDQLTLPDFTNFTTSASDNSRPPSSQSSPGYNGERRSPQAPSANSENFLPTSPSLISRPESVSIYIDNTSAINSANSIPNSGGTVNINGVGNGDFPAFSEAPAGAPSTVTPNGPTAERGFAENVRTDAGTEEALAKSLGEEKVRYERLLNKDVLAAAQGIYDQGFEGAKGYLDGAISAAKNGAKLPPEAVPLARMVANEMARNGDVVGAERIIADVAAELTQAGQLGQVGKILRQSIKTPEGKLYAMQKCVDKINDKADGKYKVELPRDLIYAYNSAETDEARDAVITQMQQSIADQVPASWMEKWNALRYTAMLGNFKTQTRNIGGNLASMVGRMAKDRLAAVMEYIGYIVSGGQMERTKSVLYDPKLFSDAWADYKNVQSAALGEGKYSDYAKELDGEIEKKRKIFDYRRSKTLIGKALNFTAETARVGTNLAMEYGDIIFSRTNYADAMAGWLAAHNIKSIADATPEQLERARAYAIQQAQEATFRDNNAVSDYVSRMGRGHTKSVFGKAMQFVGEGIMPFRKTPANILVRAEEYSPLGVLNTIYQEYLRENGEATASDVIDQAAKALTGTGIAALGYLLRAAGKLRGKSDDDKQENFDKLRGLQDWSLILGDKSFTMDWVSPHSMPLFMGAQFYDRAQDNGLSLSDAIHAIEAIGWPMLEMSMLDGLNDALEALRSYNSDDIPLTLLLEISLASYLSQGAPTLLGQIERYFEDYRKSTYTDPNGTLPTSVQRKISQTMAKIPGYDYQQQDYIDAWGRKQETPKGIDKFLETFVTPWYSSSDRSTPVDDELQRLYDSGAEGADKVFPNYASRNPGGDVGRLTPEEYDTYATVKGQTSLALVQDFIESEEYKGLSDNERAEIIQNLYKLANNSAKTAVMRQREEDYGKSDPITALVDSGMSADEAGGFIVAVSGGSLTTQGKIRQDDLLRYFNEHPEDEASIAALWDASGFTRDGKPSAWETYKGSIKPPPAQPLIDFGMSREDADKIFAAIDSMDKANGSISQKEIKAYYKSHKDDEAMLRALWDSMGWKTSFDKGVKK